MIKTKIVATVGPACNSEEMIGRMIDGGVNVFRLNFSHGTLEEHGEALARIRRMAREKNAVVAVMGDLCGPKIRVDPIENGECELAEGSPVVFQRETILGTAARMSTNYDELVIDAKVGHRVLIDDGNVQLRVTESRENEIVCTCEVGGVVKTRKGINLPDSDVSTPALTDKDRTDLEWAIAYELDYIALSFVRRPEDLTQLRAILDRQNSPIDIVSKIERPEAIQHLERIVEESDVVLVARGDLGVEMDVSRVPILQKEIALMAHRAGKPVIIATQMLQSMVDSPVPTRAEVSDVANAILDHTDAVMLSAETSIGEHPVAAVRMMRRIAEQTEAFSQRHPEGAGSALEPPLRVARAIVHGVSRVAADLDVRTVVVWSESGDTPRLLSKHRLGQMIVALAPNPVVCRQMALIYGVIPVQRVQEVDLLATMGIVEEVILNLGLAKSGDTIVVTGDTRPDIPGETDAMLIHEVGSIAERK